MEAEDESVARRRAEEIPKLAGRDRWDDLCFASPRRVIKQRLRPKVEGVAPENLDRDSAGAVKRLESAIVPIGKGHPPQPEIDKRTPAKVRDAVCEGDGIDDRWNGIRHLQERRDSTSRRRHRGVGEVLLLRLPGVARVNVRVDDAGKREEPASIEDSQRAPTDAPRRFEARDPAVTDDDVRVECPSRHHDPGARDDQICWFQRPLVRPSLRSRRHRSGRPRLSARPGLAPVCSPSVTTDTPFTITWRIPSGNWRGSSYVDDRSAFGAEIGACHRRRSVASPCFNADGSVSPAR